MAMEYHVRHCVVERYNDMNSEVKNPCKNRGFYCGESAVRLVKLWVLVLGYQLESQQ